MATSGDRLQQIVQRYDTALVNAEDATLERVNAALESAYRQLEQKLLRSYQKHFDDTDLLPGQRRLLILDEISAYLELLNPKAQEQIEKDFEGLLRGTYESGVSLSEEMVRAIANEKLRSFSNVPLEAIRFQAQESSKRLYRWSEAMRGNISGIVEMHLAMGSGNRKVASALRNELGILKGRAVAIARTENISSLDLATRANYKRNEIGYVQRLGTQDDRICGYCASRVGNVYRVDQAPAAIHPQDRCYNTPFKPEWVKLGLVDLEWWESHREDAIAQSEQEPNYGVAPFERMNGVSKPEAVYTLKDLKQMAV